MNRKLKSVNTENGLRWQCQGCKELIIFDKDICKCNSELQSETGGKNNG